jgi:superfamily II DNA or RNA helicase
MNTQIEFEGGEYFVIRFPYHQHFVRWIRNLANRRWDHEEKCWYVHVQHLAAVMQMFQIQKAELPPKLWRAYQIHRIRTSTIRLVVGNTLAYFEGDRLPLGQIDQVTSYFVPGYRYMPNYQAQRWDGKRHLFDMKKLSFPAGLVSRVINVLEQNKTSYQLVEDSFPSPPAVSYNLPRFELRDYQQECVEKALSAKRGVLELAAGSGKTAVAAQIIYELGMPAIFFVHTRDLLHQTHQFFRTHLSDKVGIVGDGKVHLAPLTVATLQTIGNAFGIVFENGKDEEFQVEEDLTDVSHSRNRLVAYVRECPVVFFDECHHLPAESFYSLAMETTGARYRFGLSATPYRADKLDLLLEAAVGPKIFRANASALIDMGYLVPPEIRFLAPPAFHSAPSRRLDYQTVFQEYVITNPDRNKLIAKEARRFAKQGKSVLILITQVAHGERLVELLPEADFVSGEMPASRRQSIFKKLQTKKQLIVIATTLADEGLDVPTLDAVILGSGGKSETRALQRIGRALRPAPHKEKAYIIDFFDNAPFLKDHSLRRLEIYSTEPRFVIHTEGFSL